MTVLSTENSYIQYTTNGVTKYFEYGFVRYPGDTILVYLNNKRFYDFTEQAKGIVIKPAPKKGTLIIAKETPITQERDFTAFDSFDASWTEDAMDKLILLKQQAARFRAFINLDADQYLNYTVIDNDKGSVGVIYLWNNERSGVFSGEVTAEMPPAGSATYKPENFVWLQYGDTEILTQTVTSTLYSLESIDGMTFSFDMDGGGMREITSDEADHSFAITDVVMTEVLITTGPHDDDVDHGFELTDVVMESKLISAFSPDDGIELTFDVDAANCSMTPV